MIRWLLTGESKSKYPVMLLQYWVLKDMNRVFKVFYFTAGTFIERNYCINEID